MKNICVCSGILVGMQHIIRSVMRDRRKQSGGEVEYEVVGKAESPLIKLTGENISFPMLTIRSLIECKDEVTFPYISFEHTDGVNVYYVFAIAQVSQYIVYKVETYSTQCIGRYPLDKLPKNTTFENEQDENESNFVVLVTDLYANFRTEGYFSAKCAETEVYKDGTLSTALLEYRS